MRGLLLALLVLLATPARAQVLTLGSFANWTAFGGAQQDGQRVCGLALRGEGRSAHFRYFAGRPEVQVELFKRGWNFPQRVAVPLSLQAGRFTTPTLQGTGHPPERRLPSRVVVPIDYAGSEGFWQALRTAPALQLRFAAGREPAWSLPAARSAEALTAMTDCLRRMGAPVGPIEDRAVTQPFAPPRRP